MRDKTRKNNEQLHPIIGRLYALDACADGTHRRLLKEKLPSLRPLSQQLTSYPQQKARFADSGRRKGPSTRNQKRQFAHEMQKMQTD